MAISSTARMLSNAPINIVHPYIFNVNIHFTVSHCSAGDSTTGIPFGHHSAALLGMTYFFVRRKLLVKSQFGGILGCNVFIGVPDQSYFTANKRRKQP